MGIIKRVVDRPSLVDGANAVSGKGMGKGASIPFRALRSIFDGLAGTSSHNYGAKTWRDSNGQSVRYNPIQKTGRRAAANLETMLTGRRTHANTREVIDKDQDAGFFKRNHNRAWAGVHFASNMTLGMAGASLGWGIKGATMGSAALAFGTARPMARFIGGATYETAGTIHEMTRGIHGLSRGSNAASVRTSDMLMLGAFGAATIGGMAIASESLSDKKFSGYAEAIPGTMESSQRMVDTGADGDLVFALHNMR